MTTACNLPNLSLLDNPIWSSLTTGHAPLALGAGVGRELARRYPAEIAALSGLQEPTTAAYEDLAAIIPAGDVATLFLEEKPTLPAGWKVWRDATLVQMICPEAPEQQVPDFPLLPLTPQDYPEMVELATLTNVGPLRKWTGDLGDFVGVRLDGRLAAMAGQRLAPEGFREVSIVCTHPDFRGRGYAQALIAQVTRNIHESGRIPFLLSGERNTGAIRLYERLGFSVLRKLEMAIVLPPMA